MLEVTMMRISVMNGFLNARLRQRLADQLP